MYQRMEYGLMKRRLPSGKIVYYYWVYDANGKRVYRSTGQRTKSKAVEYVLKQRDEGNLGKLDKWGALLKDFAADMFIQGKCPIEKEALARGTKIAGNTMKNRRISLTKHILPYLGNVRVSALTSAQVNEWLVSLPKKDHISRTTSNQQLDTLSTIMRFAVKHGVAQNNPCSGVELLNNDSTPVPAFTIEEIKALVARPEDWKNPQLRLMCLTATITGMRIGEVLALKPKNVHHKYIDVKHSISPVDGLTVTKSRRPRIVPIIPMLYEELEPWFPSDGDAFIFSPDGVKPYSENAVAVALRTRCRKLGIEKGKSFHSFRAFFDSVMMSRNVNESVVRKVIGHTDAKMTEHYLHIEASEFPMITVVQNDVGNQITGNCSEIPNDSGDSEALNN